MTAAKREKHWRRSRRLPEKLSLLELEEKQLTEQTENAEKEIAALRERAASSETAMEAANAQLTALNYAEEISLSIWMMICRHILKIFLFCLIN